MENCTIKQFIVIIAIMVGALLFADTACFAEDAVHFFEDFGTPETVSEQPLATSTSVGYGGWLLGTNVYEQAKSESTELIIMPEPENESNNILRLVRTTGGNTATANLRATHLLPVTLNSDTVKVSMRMMYKTANYCLMVQPFIESLRPDGWRVQGSSERMEARDEAQIVALTQQNVWHSYEFILNYTMGEISLYVDGLLIGQPFRTTLPALESIGLLMPRHYHQSNGEFYIDDLTVTHIPDPEYINFEQIANGQRADDVRSDLNLVTTHDIYTIRWESSQSDVIGTDGRVTQPSMVDTPVQLTAQISLTANGVHLSARQFSVTVPAKGEQLFMEDFENGMEGDYLATSFIEGYNGWVLDRHDTFLQALEEGTISQLTPDPEDDDNMTLQVTRTRIYPHQETVHYMPKKEIDPINTGMVTLSGRIRPSYTSFSFMLEPIGNIGSTHLRPSSDFNNGIAYPLTPEETALWQVNKWNSFSFVLNFHDKTMLYYINGQQVGGLFPMGLRELNKLVIYIARNGTQGTHHMDNLTIKRITLTDEESVAMAMAALKLETPTEGVTENLTLAQTSYNGTTLVWNSEYPEVISNEGRVFRPVGADVMVRMTVTVSKNEVEQQREFDVLVKGVSALEHTANQITFKNIGNGQQAALVTKNLNLIQRFGGEYLTVCIEWSSNKDFITPEGIVTLPDYQTEVRLTARIYEENSSEAFIERVFQVMVLGRGETVFSDSFEDKSGTIGQRIKDWNGWEQLIYDFHGHEVTLEIDPLDPQNRVMQTDKIERATEEQDVSQEPMDHFVEKVETGLLSYSMRFMMTAGNNSIGMEPLLTAIYADRWRYQHRVTGQVFNLYYREKLPAAVLSMNQWHTAEVLHDFDRGTVDFYMDGVKLNDEPLPMEITEFTRIRIKAQRLEPLQLWYVDDIVLRKLAIADDNAVQEAVESIDLGDIHSVSENFVLPTLGDYGTTITWSTLAPEAVEIVGNLAVVKREAGKEKQAILTAKVTRNEGITEKQFLLTITAISLIEEMTEDFTFAQIGGNQKPYYITEDLTLTDTYKGTMTIQWISNNLEAISEKGVVTRERQDVPVTLSAEFTAYGESFEKTFSLVVAGTGAVLVSEDFSAPSVEGQDINGYHGWKVEDPIGKNSILATLQKDITDAVKPYDQAERVLSIQRFLTKSEGEVSNQKIKKSFPKSHKNEVTAIDFDFLFTSSQSTLYAEIEGMQRHYAITRTGMGLKGGAELSFNRTLETNRWYHLSIVQDAYRNTYDLYLDYEKVNDEPIYAPGNRTISGINFYSNAKTATVREGFMIRRIMVRDLTLSAEQAVSIGEKALEIGTIDYDRAKIELPLYGEENTAIRWQSSHPDVISEEGQVTRQAHQQEVKLTAVIEKGGRSKAKEFQVTVLSTNGKEPATKEILWVIAEQLTEKNITEEPRLRLTKDLVLPMEITTGKAADIGGVNISWESNYPAIVSAQGVINRQPYESAATLTATLTAKGNSSVFVQKQLRFAVDTGGEVYFAYDFEDVPPNSVGEELTTWSTIQKRAAENNTEYGTQFFADKEPADALLSQGQSNRVMFLNRYTTATYDMVSTMSHATIMDPMSGVYFYGDMLALSFKVKFLSAGDNLRMTIYCLKERNYYLTRTSLTVSSNMLAHRYSEELPLHQWHEFLFYYDTVSSRMDIYVNGEYILSEPLDYGEGAFNNFRQWRFFNDKVSHLIVDDIEVRKIVRPEESKVVSSAVSMVNLPTTTSENLSLPTSVGNCTVTWSSSDESVISDSGQINPSSSGSRSAVMKALFRYGDGIQTKEYPITVLTQRPYTKEYEITEIHITGDQLTDIRLSKAGTSAQEANLMVLVYNQNQLQDVYSYSLPVMSQNQSKEIAMDISLEDFSNYKVKAFVWDYYETGNEPLSNIGFAVYKGDAQ